LWRSTRMIATSVLELDAEALGHPIQRPAIDAQDLGRARAVAAHRVEHVPQISALEVVEGRQIRERLIRVMTSRSRDDLGKIRNLDERATTQRHETLDRVAKLAYVARPAVGEERVESFGR